MRQPTLVRAFAPLLLALAVAACDDGDLADASAGGLPDVDTLNEEAIDGVSTEQLRAAAEAMSPEQAEALGIVDSTIRISNPNIPDTLPGSFSGVTPPEGPQPAPSDLLPPAPEPGGEP